VPDQPHWAVVLDLYPETLPGIRSALRIWHEHLACGFRRQQLPVDGGRGQGGDVAGTRDQIARARARTALGLTGKSRPASNA
jgi:hypothetical protein